jgi:hypothetical protein
MPDDQDNQAARATISYRYVGGIKGWEGSMHVKLREPFLGVEGDESHYGIGANSTIPRTGQAFLLLKQLLASDL